MPDTFSDAIDQTRLYAMLHNRSGTLAPGDGVPDPLIMSSAFALSAQPDPDRTYARTGTPTVQAAEARLALLEDAPTLLFPSGMGAYGALLMSALKAGDRILLLSDGYYAARSLTDEVLAPFGISFDTVSATEIADAPLDGYALVLIETPSNPGLHVIDIAKLATRAHAAGARLVVDNTVCTPLLQRPLDLGADAVIVSDTKAMAGHSDLLLGHVSTRDSALMERLITTRNFAGAIPAPFEAWLFIRGLETLQLRLAAMCANARALLPLLVAAPCAQDIIYPEPHPQAADQGFLIGATFADADTADRFLELAGFTPTTSFGGLHSSGDRRARWGDDVPPGFLRLSIGIEPADPLCAAVERALAAL
jgi:cystathionine gamma-lyase